MAKAPDPRPMLVVPEWIEAHCVIPDGFRKGQPFHLYDYQLQYFGNFYLVRGDAVWVPENPILAPAFVYSRGLLVGPQKLGKGPHTAAHTCVEGVGPAIFAGWAGKGDGYACADHGCRCGWEYAYEPGEPMGMPWPTPLIQITAFSEEQTQNIYDALRPMVEEGPLADIIPKTGEEFIRLPGGGRIDTVTASANSRLGQRITFAPQDETGVWTKRNKMDRVADTQYRGLAGMGGRASLTSNGWDPSEKSIMQREYESAARDVYRQMAQAPKKLDFRKKRERRRIFQVVYPPDVLRENGGHIDLDSIEAEAVKLMEHDPPQAMRFYGNMIVAGQGAAVDPEKWAKRHRPKIVVPDGAYIGLGFDGSLSDDATALIGCTAEGHLFPIGIWLAGDGKRIPKHEVEEAVAETFRRFKVGRMFGDPPKWQTELERWALRYGEETVLLFDTNQPKRMSEACDRFSTALADDAITWTDTPLLTPATDRVFGEHVLAMARRKAYVKVEDETDGRTRFVFTKGEDGRKIDAGIGAVLAVEAAMSMPEKTARESFFLFS